MDFHKAFETNRITWNQKVDVHSKSEFYNMTSFKKGESSLNSYELNALGDVSGKTMLHLQCHFGQDTLSWQRMGAQCTGVDLSDEGIKLARELNSELGLDAQFVCCNVLDTSKFIQEQFDIVFTSYGVIGWLPNLKPWAKMIAERLKPGGTFYMVEFHPIVWMFDYLVDPPVLRYGYDQEEAIYEEYEGSYGDDGNAEMISKEYGWNHGLSEVIGSLLDAGLQLESCKEYHESPYDVLSQLQQNERGYYEIPSKLYPLLFELQFKKP